LLAARRAPHPGSARRVPATVIAGLSLMAGAFGLDLVAHGASLVAVEPVAHLAGMAGMAMTWLAVVVDGIRRPLRP
jgi:hypothetical protein